MAFPDSLIVEMRRRAHFQCCLCKELGVEIHHILPQSEGGPDTPENAAPLCPSCHETYGANPTKRKFIREVKAHWFEICEKRYSSDPSLIQELRAALSESASKSDISNLRSEIVKAMAWLKPGEKAKVIEIPLVKSEAGAEQMLGIRDLHVLLYGTTSERPSGQLELLCMKELWPIKDGWRRVYNEFNELFGSRTFRQLASRALDMDSVDTYEGLTEDEITSALRWMLIEAVLITGLELGNFTARLMANGEIGWKATSLEPVK